MEKSKFIIAIDLGCENLVATISEKSVDGKINIVDFVIKPIQGITLGEVTNIEDVTKTIKEAISELEHKHNITISRAYATVSGKQLCYASSSGFAYVGSDGEIKEDTVKKLCENMNDVQPPDGKSILARIPQHYTIDSERVTGKLIGKFGAQLEATYSLILASRNSIDRLEKSFERVGIKIDAFYPSPIASAVAVATDQEKKDGVLVIDLGANTTNICIYQNSVIRYIGVIPIGADAINKDIRAHAIPENFIEQLKTNSGYATTSAIPKEYLNSAVLIPKRTPQDRSVSISYRDLSTIIEARLLDIIEFVIEEIKVSGYKDLLSAGIILTGGGSLVAGIDILFKERTGYDVRLASASQNLTETSIDLVINPQLTASIGVIMLSTDSSLIDTMVTPSVKEEEIVIPEVTKKPKKVDNKDTTPTSGGLVERLARLRDKFFGEDDDEIM